MITSHLDAFIIVICKCLCLVYYMNNPIHATPVHPSLCLQYFNTDVYYNRYYCYFYFITAVTLLLSLLENCCY